MKTQKVVMIGCGYVGSTTVYTMMMAGTANEIVIIDANREKAEGDALDINHGLSFLTPTALRVGDYPDCRDADVVVITAGASQRPGETRSDLLGRNISIFKSILDNVMQHIGDKTILLVVTNPVDVLAAFTRHYTGLDASRVLGSGTVLDTARLKYAIAEHAGIDARNVHTFVIGEHGDTEVAAFSATSISGMTLLEYCQQCGQCADSGLSKLGDLHAQVRDAAYEIINKKGATFYAVALAVNRILQAILNNQKAILTVSTQLTGQYGLPDVYLSLPCVVGLSGVEKILTPTYSDDELAALRRSADAIKTQMASFA